ncbi:MAG: hypothetical protein RQ736_02350 [Thiogranum sp.]|nr:hypothetical protein [Thiogranum sp.]
MSDYNINNMAFCTFGPSGCKSEVKSRFAAKQWTTREFLTTPAMKTALLKCAVAFLARLVLGVCLVPGSASAVYFFVDSTEDSTDANPGDGICADTSANCTLRAAVMEANAFAGADTIYLGQGTYRLAIPGNAEHAAATGDLDVLDTLTINGINATSTIIDAGGIDRAFELINAGPVTMSRLTIQNGIAGRNTPGYGVDFAGGGIFNVGNTSSLMLNEVVIRNNSARTGGGLFNIFSSMTVANSAIYDNTATAGNGGGIGEGIGGYVEIYNSTLSGNSAT